MSPGRSVNGSVSVSTCVRPPPCAGPYTVVSRARASGVAAQNIVSVMRSGRKIRSSRNTSKGLPDQISTNRPSTVVPSLYR